MAIFNSKLLVYQRVPTIYICIYIYIAYFSGQEMSGNITRIHMAKNEMYLISKISR